MAYIPNQMGASFKRKPTRILRLVKPVARPVGPLSGARAYTQAELKQALQYRMDNNLGGLFDNILTSAKSIVNKGITDAKSSITYALTDKAKQEAALISSKYITKLMQQKNTTKQGYFPALPPPAAGGGNVIDSKLPAVQAGNVSPVVAVDLKQYVPYAIAAVGGIVILVMIARRK